MNLQRVSNLRPGQSLHANACCGKMVQADAVFADLDAPFGTFYCDHCAVMLDLPRPDPALSLDAVV